VKNFPHQYNDFPKLRQTLEAIRDLVAADQDVADDGVLGYELARRGIYTFRALEGPLEARIAAEQAKPTGSQGPRTAAREMRRTLAFLGWLDAAWRLTESGQAFLATAPGSEAERTAWQQAILDLTLEEEGSVSHPVRILLRLVADDEVVARHGLELALEARDDSEAEYERIRALLPLSPNDRLRAIGATEHQVANAVKILPSFAEQANLIHRASPQLPYTLTEAGHAALGEGIVARPVELRPEIRAPRRRRTRGAPRRASARSAEAGTAATPDDWSSLSHEEQIAATRLRFERTARHQELLRQLIEALSQLDGERLEDPASFDLLDVPSGDGPLTLFELKTIEADELTQTRLAVGQLLSYEHLVVRPRWPGRDVRRVAVFEEPIDDDLSAFLAEVGIAAFVMVDGALEALNDRAASADLSQR
jgi:hypothetical protein